MILQANLIIARNTVALIKFFVTCVRIRHIIYEILCYSVIYGRGLYMYFLKTTINYFTINYFLKSNLQLFKPLLLSNSS